MIELMFFFNNFETMFYISFQRLKLGFHFDGET